MISNKFKLFLLVCIFLYQTSVNSKTKEAEDFNPKYLSNYLSAIISYGNQNNEESVKYFNSSKVLVDEYKGYLKDYVFALVLNGEVQKAINQVKKSNDPKVLNTLKTQLDRLNAIGGLKAVVPSEGITFMFKGKLYKYTGAFAPANQILGMLKFV